MPIQFDYIQKFLNDSDVEGPRRTEAYVPARPGNFYGRPSQVPPSMYTAIGASGVTVATGCDWGQTDPQTLKAYGVSSSTIETLRLYLGAKKAAAIALLAQHPITISDAMAAELDNAIHGGYLRKYVIPAFEKASSVSFESLPKQAQAVIMSVCFQKGCGGVRRDWPKLWGYLTACNWPAAANELRTGFSEYTVRRRREGALLAELC